MIASIGIIGVGGVGGYFGGKLCHLRSHNSDLQVSFVARGEHLHAIRESGLLLSSEADGELVCKPSIATDDFRNLPPLDLCVVCVKEFDLAAALSGLKPLVGDNTIVLPLLNGVDVHARVRKVITRGIVLPACVYVGTHIERPGRVVQRGGACRILFGPDPMRPDFAPDELLALFGQARIKADWTLDVQGEIWKKFIFICAFGLVSAAFERTLGEILANTPLRNEVRSIMNEVVLVASASGVALPADIIEASIARAQTFPFETKTSFQRDFERRDKADERDLFAGTLIRMGTNLGISTPRTKELSARLDAKKPHRDAAALRS